MRAFFEKRSSRGSAGENALWIYLLVLQNTGETDRFKKILKQYDGLNPFLLEEKTRLLEHDGETTASLRVMEKLMQKRPGDPRIKITYAQFFNRYERKKESQEVLETF